MTTDTPAPTQLVGLRKAFGAGVDDGVGVDSVTLAIAEG